MDGLCRGRGGGSSSTDLYAGVLHVPTSALSHDYQYYCYYFYCNYCAGALVGPPWSKRENGFVLSESHQNGIRLYYEPHCDYDSASVARIGKVDAVVTPANSQVLIKFPLVCSFASGRRVQQILFKRLTQSLM